MSENTELTKNELIKRNIQISKCANYVMEVARDIIGEFNLTDEETKRVWEKVLGDELGVLPKTNFTPMTYDEARAFYRTHTMTFGKWRGTKLDEVEWNYLTWLDDQPDFRRDLTRFLMSDFVKNNHYINSK